MPDPDRHEPETDALVERWFLDCVHGSPIARSTEAWNQAHAAKDELKRRLAAHIATRSAASATD